VQSFLQQKHGQKTESEPKLDSKIWRIAGFGTGFTNFGTGAESSLKKRLRPPLAWTGSGLDILQDTYDFFGSGLDLDI